MLSATAAMRGVWPLYACYWLCSLPKQQTNSWSVAWLALQSTPCYVFFSTCEVSDLFQTRRIEEPPCPLMTLTRRSKVT